MSFNIHKLQYYFDLKNNKSCHEVDQCFKNGIVNSHLCVNAFTAQRHTELDSSYTLISVPNQLDPEWNKVCTKFHFHIQPNKQIIIPMKEKVCFVFSGYMLTHNQSNNVQVENNDDIQFINIATYSNKRLFDNMKKSLKRTLKLS